MNRKISKVVSLLLVFSLFLCLNAAPASAAGVSTDAEAFTVDASELKALNYASMRQRAIAFPAGQGSLFDLGYIAAGKTITVTIQYTPANVPMWIGMMRYGTTDITYVEVPKSPASITITINVSDGWYLAVINPNNVAVSVSVLNVTYN